MCVRVWECEGCTVCIWRCGGVCDYVGDSLCGCERVCVRIPVCVCVCQCVCGGVYGCIHACNIHSAFTLSHSAL